MRCYRLVPFALLIVACFPGPPPPLTAPGPQSAGVAIARARPGREVRLVSPGVGRVTGRLLLFIDDSVTVETHAGRMTMDVASVDTVWLHRQNGFRTTGRGLISGLIAGGVVALVIVSRPQNNFGDGNDSGLLALAALTSGALGGTLLGAAAGASAPEWVLVYPSSNRPPW